MKTVFVVQHEYEWCGRDEVKFIGVYVTRSDAEAAVARLRLQPGFRDWPEGFLVEECTLGQDQWAEGFSTMVNVLVPSTRKEGEYCAAMAAWHPGDIYKICSLDEELEPALLAFKVGELVRCEERTINGGRRGLVAVGLAEGGP
jgi:hypothetical protein